MSIHIFGIRHHGPGSARSLRQALTALKPDIILVEGPPDADDLLPLITDSEMQPPVALLIYAPEKPARAVYYPFAIFSPEWQALQYGLEHQLPIRFCDLPQMYQLAMPEKFEKLTINKTDQKDQQRKLRRDPLGWLARAAGYHDGERWWEHMVEHRRDSADLFAAILEAMTALRSENLDLPDLDDEDDQDLDDKNNSDDERVQIEELTKSESLIEAQREAQREAYMRQSLRAAQKEGFQRIAVVCGAWHAPALADLPPPKADAALLKGLPKIKVTATWVPWTHGRLSYQSGYGAGVESPGWYQHLWKSGEIATTEVVINWMTEVARLLRGEDLDASVAHVIESVRLAESLAALRDRPLPGLPELNEAIQAIFCFGDSLPMKLIQEKLIVGEKLGAVPSSTPMVPLQRDLLQEQKRLRLPAEASQRVLDLDLRKENDLARSYLLHRLTLLGIAWGKLEAQSGRQRSTFHEIWRLQWQPEFSIELIEASIWGNNIVDAAIARVRRDADESPDLPTLTALLEQTLLADLPDGVSYLMNSLQERASLATDISHLMASLPALANVMRYGNVRKTDTGMVRHVIDGLIARICIGLPVASASLNDEAAAAMFEQINLVNGAISLLQIDEHIELWRAVIKQLLTQSNLHGLLAGRCCRLLLDAKTIELDEAARFLGLALSPAGDPAQAAAWIEGFLKGSGLLLLYDDQLWQVIDEWTTSLNAETFTTILPLLRRTFATFAPPERRQMGERVKRGGSAIRATQNSNLDDIDHQRSQAVLPLIAKILMT